MKKSVVIASALCLALSLVSCAKKEQVNISSIGDLVGRTVGCQPAPPASCI